MFTCTSCGCAFDVDGFYHHPQTGEVIQPCKICRCDQQSIYYYNNAEDIREQRRNRYYADIEASRTAARIRMRQQRADARQNVRSLAS